MRRLLQGCHHEWLLHSVWLLVIIVMSVVNGALMIILKLRNGTDIWYMYVNRSKFITNNRTGLSKNLAELLIAGV